jgi:hypothetical protein
LLRTASRKVGSEIQCPKCDFLQTVPNEEAAALTVALGRRRKNPPSLVEFFETGGENDQEAAGEAIPAGHTTPPNLPATSYPMPPAAFPKLSRRIMRRTHYVQAILVAGTAVAAFLAGYWIGRSDALSGRSDNRLAAGREQVLLQGRLVYDPGTQRLTGDGEAVVIVLPHDRFPNQLCSPYGVRPGDSPPTESNLTVLSIRHLGGAYVRADESGDFSVVLPEGKYRILMISRHTIRPPDLYIDELDKTQIGRYFSEPEELLRTSKYRWISTELSAGVDAPVEHNFGRDGKA